MSKKRQNWMKKADVVFSKIVRGRDRHCQACGSTEYLQCAHIISRGYKATRCDLDNAIALCRGCHMYFTHHELEWQDWIEENYPGRWDGLRERALSYERVNWKDKLEELREMAAEMEAA